MLKVSEVSNALGVNPKTVRKWINKGMLPGYRLGSEYRVKESDLEEFLEKAKIGD